MQRLSLLRALLLLTLATGFSRDASATPFTVTSPVNGGTALPADVTLVGGLVLDLVGLDGTRVVSQLSASSLFVGFYDGGTPATFNGNPGTIGVQTGFSQAVTDALAGGISELALRVTLFDGDTASGNFDFNANALLINGQNLGNWSAVNAENTNATGTNSGGTSGGGFRDNLLDTGFFYSTDAALLAGIYGSLIGAQQVLFQVQDATPFDNFYDFTQGVDGGLINVGQGPTVTPFTPITAIPEPGTLLLMGSGLLALYRAGRKHRR